MVTAWGSMVVLSSPGPVIEVVFDMVLIPVGVIEWNDMSLGGVWGDLGVLLLVGMFGLWSTP